MANRRWWVLIVSAVLVLAACSSGDDEADSPFFADQDAGDGDGGGDGAGGGDGGGSDAVVAAGQTEGGTPYPAGGFDVLADAGIEISGQRQFHYPTDQTDELIAFYDDWVDGLDGQTGRAEVDGTIVWQVFNDEGGLSIITIEPNAETTLGGEDIVVTFVLLVDG